LRYIARHCLYNKKIKIGNRRGRKGRKEGRKEKRGQEGGRQKGRNIFPTNDL
jgi:hypothetical protein